MNGAILPGATLGVIGAGQLGRMFTFAARRMGYGVHVLGPDREAPAAQVADHVVVAAYDDLAAVERFARNVDAITCEFENVSVKALRIAETLVPVRPGPGAFEVIQHRLQEKMLIRRAGLATAPFAEVKVREQLQAVVAQLGTPLVLKTLTLGYDGKGQRLVRSAVEADEAWEQLAGQALLAESWLDLVAELSVVVARGADGEMACFGPIENWHEHHILDMSLMPARLPARVGAEAERIAMRLAGELAYVGVLCVEFFLTRDGRLLVNELAPRPHNSGHLTIEACFTSQFEQQVRTVCRLPLGDTQMRGRAAGMANLLGELWQRGEPSWAQALRQPGVTLHLYGKNRPSVGRKMGHLTALGATRREVLERLHRARAALAPPDVVPSTGRSALEDASGRGVPGSRGDWRMASRI